MLVLAVDQPAAVIAWPAVAAGVLSVLGIIAAVFAGARWVVRTARPVAEMARDWHGTPARPGVPARDGVMVRLERHDARLAHVEAELSPNGGRTVKDRVDATYRRVDQMAGE